MALKCKTVLCYTPALVEEPNSFHFGAEGVRRPEQQVLQRGASARRERRGGGGGAGRAVGFGGRGKVVRHGGGDPACLPRRLDGVGGR